MRQKHVEIHSSRDKSWHGAATAHATPAGSFIHISTYRQVMSSTVEDRREEGVEFTDTGDFVTARGIETGVASSGESKAEALAMLPEALSLHEGGGEPIEDEDDSPPPCLA
jgi:predicted RNase H-like HicB family nuclease